MTRSKATSARHGNFPHRKGRNRARGSGYRNRKSDKSCISNQRLDNRKLDMYPVVVRPIYDCPISDLRCKGQFSFFAGPEILSPTPTNVQSNPELAVTRSA